MLPSTRIAYTLINHPKRTPLEARYTFSSRISNRTIDAEGQRVREQPGGSLKRTSRTGGILKTHRVICRIRHRNTGVSYEFAISETGSYRGPQTKADALSRYLRDRVLLESFSIAQSNVALIESNPRIRHRIRGCTVEFGFYRRQPPSKGNSTE